MAYDGWGVKQAEIDETRNCNGLVAVVDYWSNWVSRTQNAIVKENIGQYKCSYDHFGVYDWMDDTENKSIWGRVGCWCNPSKDPLV